MRLGKSRVKYNLGKFGFWATACKTVRSVLSDRCLCPVCPVCNVGVLWPNGWMDQDATWHEGGPWPIVLHGDPVSPRGGGTASPIFSPCLLWPNGWMDQDATGVRLQGPGHIVLDGDPTLPRKNGHSSSPTVRPMSIMAKRSPISVRQQLLSSCTTIGWSVHYMEQFSGLCLLIYTNGFRRRLDKFW